MRIAILAAAAVISAGAANAAERGVTPSGLHYTIYDDGEATVSRVEGPLNPDWKVKCAIDRINDKTGCLVMARRSPVVVDFGYSNSPQRVRVSGHDFPGRTAIIRAGKSKPLTTAENGCVSAARILPTLLAAETVATRKYHWPYAEGRDEFGTLVGLPEALSIVTSLRSRVASN